VELAEDHEMKRDFVVENVVDAYASILRQCGLA
jgi:hypothetical protein